LIDAWNENEMDSLMLLAPVATSIGYDGPGDFNMDSTGRLTRQTGARLAPFIFAGVSIAHPRLFDGAPQGAFSLNKLWNRAIDAGRLFGIRLEGIWMHVGTPDAIGEAENTIANSMAAGSTLPGED
jgi:MurNAc alpha-1-phosphate uridylyltransferase